MNIDRSEGYDAIAAQFMAARSDIGAGFVRCWARDNLPPLGAIVDVGCGSGVPIAQALIEDGFTLFGIDASPSLLTAFRDRFPNAPAACETAQNNPFFARTFDAAVSIGLLFLLGAEDQATVLQRVAHALRPGGRFLFTAPRERCEWQDVLTDRPSRSLGAGEYQRLLEASGLCLIDCHEEENYFYYAIKLG